jgi:D-alanyl-lipoteichoic acid acyltransferase DltB (MBOAT superfamily)
MLGKSESDKDRKALLWMSLAVNLGLLGVFKYYNFFTENFTEAFRFFGMVIQPNMLKIILPVGISFYTFQTLSYTIDVYREKLEPTKDFISFAAFVSFFPQLVAGPIERATHLLPQFYQERKFDYGLATEGMRQILWGLFKKVVIADNCAQYANNIFANSADHSGSTLVLGALFFTFQIYGDFSGYSDIAIGTARLFGFDLMQNFAYPYFSRDIAEFWRRWHISLSTWFRDYLYIPLGGSRGNLGQTVRNIFIIFVVSGFWHGANWTFIAWGALNAIYFLPLLLLNLNRNNMGTVAAGRFLPTLRESFAMGVTFGLTVLAWIFFRAESISHAFAYLGGILDASLISLPEVLPKKVLLLVFFFLLVEWLGREELFAFGGLPKRMSRPLRWTTYYCIIGMIVFFAGDQESFIYFQF